MLSLLLSSNIATSARDVEPLLGNLAHTKGNIGVPQLHNLHSPECIHALCRQSRIPIVSKCFCRQVNLLAE